MHIVTLRPKEGVGGSRTEVADGCTFLGLGTELGSFDRVVNDLNY